MRGQQKTANLVLPTANGQPPMDLLFNIIGLSGVALIITAYFFIQSGRFTGDMLAYPVMNLIGAVLLLISLMWSWNLPSVVIEICWTSISIYGIIRILYKKGRK